MVDPKAVSPSNHLLIYKIRKRDATSKKTGELLNLFFIFVFFVFCYAFLI